MLSTYHFFPQLRTNRSTPRYRVPNKIRAGFVARGFQIHGELQMVGRRGMFFGTNQEIVAGLTGRMVVELPNGIFRARVVVRSMERGRGIGFEIVRINASDQELLQLFCSSLDPGIPLKNSRARGFSLIELLIVVSIILIIAAIAIPSILQSRMAANQASAVASCRTINTAEVNYVVTYNQGFSPDLISLGPPSTGPPTASAAELIDDILAAGNKGGYVFEYTPGPAPGGQIQNYQLSANPETPGTTGTNYYFTDASGVIRQNSINQASTADSPVGN